MVDDAPPEPPSHLSAESRALWRQLVRAWVFEEHELPTLRMALEALDRAASARRALRRHGVTFEDRFGTPHLRPEAKLELDSRASWLRLMGELDLDVEDDPAQPRTIRGRFGDGAKGRVRLAKAAS